MVDPRCVEYIRANKEKYPLEALKAALLKAGVSPADVEEAVRLAAAPPPREIPVEFPDRIELAINLKTAKRLGLEIPQQILLRVDRAIK